MYEANRQAMSDGGSLPTTATEAAQKRPQVEGALTDLSLVIEHNEKLAAELEQRLSGVLRNEPEATSGGKQDEITVVPVANRIRESIIRLNRQADKLNSMLRRLEV